MRRMGQDPDVASHALSKGVLRRILRFARPYRGLIALFVGLVVVAAALAVAPPLLFKVLIDNGVLAGNRGVVIQVALIVAALAVLQAVLGLVQRWCSSKIGEGLIFDMRTRVFDHVLPDAGGVLHPYPDRQAGLPTQLRRDRSPAGLHLDAVHRAVESRSAWSWCSIAMLVLSWQLTVAALIMLPIFLIPAKVVGPQAGRTHP